MPQGSDKHITIQFHFHDNKMSLKMKNASGIIKSTRSNTIEHATTKQSGMQLIESYAQRNAYDYELYKLKKELHLKVPENRLQKHIIQNKKAQLQNHDSSNKVFNQESLSLINFIGDVVFNPSHDSASASLIWGFIKTSKEQRIFNYTKTSIEKQAYQSAKSAFDKRFQKSELNSKGCLGIIKVGHSSKITSHNNSNNFKDIDFTSEVQFVKSLAPDVQLISYTGVSILSALKTAITDQINQPKLLLLNYSCPVFDLSKTEFNELKYWLDKAQARNILIISSKIDSHTIKLEKESLSYKLNKIQKAKVKLSEQVSSDCFPMMFQGKPYSIPLNQLNAIIWALRLLSISTKLKQTLKRSLKLTSDFLKHTNKLNQLHDLILPFITPGTKIETEYYNWISVQIKNEGGQNE